MSSEISAATGSTSIDMIMAEMPDWHSEFASDLADAYANHAPMVLVALDRIGGDGARLRDFFDYYRKEKCLLPPPPRRAALDALTWESAIGHRDRETDLRDFFIAEVSRLEIEAALARYLPQLAPGVGASAFHGLMRMAYAVLRKDPIEVAMALAYWSACWLTMPASTGAAPITLDPVEVLLRVSAIDALHHLPQPELLWHNMVIVGQVQEFAPVVDWLDVSGDAMARMAGAAIVLFTATQDFCALHAVTGLHWLRIIRPYSPVHELMLRHFWQGVAALMGKMGFPALPDAATLDLWRNFPVPSWSEIEAAATKSYDEHDFSITYSCREEMKLYGDPLYQLAAAKRLGLLGDCGAAFPDP
jgi:hypothetical protein